MYENGLLELPFAVIKKIHYPFSLSYLKLLGFNLNKLLINTLGLPNIIIFDSHLHDFIVNQNSFAKLPLHMKMVYLRNKHKGNKYFIQSIALLKNKGYHFMTMTELYNLLIQKYL